MPPVQYTQHLAKMEVFPESTNPFHEQIKKQLPDVLRSLSDVYSHEQCIESLRELSQNTEKPFVPLAVDVTNVCKKYGQVGSTQILDNFSMKVPAGEIYSLLGSSGCGKTTILSCIVGLKQFDSGNISVFGCNYNPENYFRDHAQIARRIGYMPQELALYEHLTVRETLKYYGKLYDLSDQEIDLRRRKLSKLLGLSSKRFAQIQDLSGGERRRVSLAISLIFGPQLLILDEPTVGLDPVIRKRVWDHLIELTTTLKTTVLITTHYIEETRLSNTIGIMRNGRMLAEDSPHSILSIYKADLLQDSILQICRIDQQEQMLKRKVSTCSIDSIPSTASTTISNEVIFQYRGRTGSKCPILDLPDNEHNSEVKFCGFKQRDPDEALQGNDQYFKDCGETNLLDVESSCHYYGSRYRRAKDYIRQSAVRTSSFSCIMWIYLIRQPIFLFILLFIPSIQLFMTFYVVGREPTDLSLGMINLEAMHNASHHNWDICQNVSFTEKTCDLKLLSCLIQNTLQKSDSVNLVQLDTKEEGEELIQQGTIFGYVTFPRNYSESLINRFMWGRFTADNETFEQSKVIITLDKSHYLAYHIILKEIVYAMEYMSNSLEAKCGFDQHNHEMPMRYREPVFGRVNGTYQENIMPAIVAQILFEILYGIAPMIMIKDVKQGTFARSNLAGLRFSEFMSGIFMTMGPMLLLQSISCYVVLQFGFGFKMHGSFLLFIVLCLMAGLCGQGFGILVGILVKSEVALIVSAIMVVPIIMTCSGTLWPLESHPAYLTYIYYIFPSAPIVSSLRSVLNRGVGITHSLVWPGLANSVVWSIVFWILSIYGFKRVAKS